jgi:hypothetical protein
VRQWAVDVPTTAVGVWVATLLLPDFRLQGPAAEQLLAVLAVAAVFLGLRTLVLIAEHRTLASAARRGERRVVTAFDEWADDEFETAVRRQMALSVIRQAVGLLLIVVVWPALLWLSVRLCGAVGMRVELLGFWPIVVSGLAVTALSRAVREMLNLVTRTGRAAPPWNLIEKILFLVVLAVMMLFGVVDMGSGPAWRQLLTLVALAALGYILSFWLTLPWLTFVVQYGINGLRLVLLEWASTVMEDPLRFTGIGPLLLTTLVLTIATWPVLAGRVRATRRPVVHDPFWPPDPLWPPDAFPRY